MAFLKSSDSLIEQLAQIERDRELYSKFEQDLRISTPFPIQHRPALYPPLKMTLPSPEDTKVRLKKAHDVVNALKTAAINHTGKKAFTMSLDLQFEIALLNYANLTHKLEFIAKTFEKSCVAVSHTVALRIIDKLQTLHANQKRAYKKLNRCFDMCKTKKLTTSMPDPPPKSHREYLSTLRVVQEHNPKYPNLQSASAIHCGYRVLRVP